MKSCSSKDIIKETTSHVTHWKKIFVRHLSKDWYPKYIKNSFNIIKSSGK